MRFYALTSSIHIRMKGTGPFLNLIASCHFPSHHPYFQLIKGGKDCLNWLGTVYASFICHYSLFAEDGFATQLILQVIYMGKWECVLPSHRNESPIHVRCKKRNVEWNGTWNEIIMECA